MTPPELVAVKSSNVLAIGYADDVEAPSGAWLWIQFQGGRTYRYENVTAAQYRGLANASSVGKAVTQITGDPSAYPVEPWNGEQVTVVPSKKAGVAIRDHTKRSNIEDRDSCWNKAADSEPVFVICAHDETAADTIRDWIKRNAGANAPKLADAEDCAMACEQYPDQRSVGR